MSAAIAELKRLDYVAELGAVQGPMGRSAMQYRVGRGCGHVIAIDAGSTHIRLRVSTFDRYLLHSSVFRLSRSQFTLSEEISRGVAQEVAVAMSAARSHWGPLRALGIAIPTYVVEAGGNLDASRQNLIFSAFRPPEGADVLLVNNVNCAAVAEGHYGAARDRGTFAYVQIGLKIGMGLVLGGQLVTGCNGAAGEIGHLSFPFAPGMRPQAGAVERYLGTESWISRVRNEWPQGGGSPPGDPAELLSMVEQGSATARTHLEAHAAEIGALVASCVSVVDPGLVVLGGGLGSSPLLVPRVQEVVQELNSRAEIRSSLLGVDATVLGIEKLVIERALKKLLGERP